MNTEYLLDQLQIFYKQLAQETSRLEEIHSNRLKCGNGCAACCIDGISIFSLEAENIRRKNKNHTRTNQTKIPGKCTFLSVDNSCTIYESRPYVCRTQGLPLRWIEEKIEYRDICPLNEEGEPIENLAAVDCFTFEDFEKKLALLQIQFDEGLMDRVKLRDLEKEL